MTSDTTSSGNLLRRAAERAKPRATRRTQLLLAAGMWTAIGVGLPTLGLIWDIGRYGSWGLLLAVPFVLLGAVKAVYILDGMADRTIARIRARSEDGCAGGFFSPRSWGLVVLMMAAGQVLRASPLPRPYLGLLYVAVGSALLISSRAIWAAWSSA